MDVVDLVDFDEVLEAHEDKVRKQASRLAEVTVLKDVENLHHHGLEVFVVFQNLRILKRTHIARNRLQTLAEDVCFATDVQVKLNVIGVLLGHLGVHFDVVFVLRVFLVVRVQQVLLAL